MGDIHGRTPDCKFRQSSDKGVDEVELGLPTGIGSAVSVSGGTAPDEKGLLESIKASLKRFVSDPDILGHRPYGHG